LIHRLLGHHSAVVAPNLKELMFPGTVGGLTRKVLSAVPQSKVNRVYSPDIHGTGANFPEADDIALLAAFSEGVFGWIYGSALKGNNRYRYIIETYRKMDNVIRGTLCSLLSLDALMHGRLRNIHRHVSGWTVRTH
jgi:hypothetical protein